jgi:hypothetical protein
MGFSLGGAVKGALGGFSSGGGIGAIAGGLAGGFMSGGSAAKGSSKAMRQASALSGSLYEPAYQEIANLYAPYTDVGKQSLGMLKSGTSDYNAHLLRRFGESDFQTDPGYRWRIQQGLDALQGSAAAKGGLFSGAAGKALNRYGQEFASNEYQKAYERYNQNQTNQFNRLYQLGVLGNQGLANVASSKRWATEGRAGAIMGSGEAKAAGILGQNNERQQDFNNMLSLGSMLYNSSNQPSSGNTANLPYVVGGASLF